MKKGLPFNRSKLKQKKDFSPNQITDNVTFLQSIKEKLETYAANVVAAPTGNHKYNIPDEDLKKLRNNYLHYNATMTIVNEPENDRKRTDIKP